jgi:hypothetical protein
MNEQNIVTTHKPVSFKEFVSLVNDQDGFGRTRRILYYEKLTRGYRYMFPIVGRKQDCYKVAYRLLFGTNLNSYEQKLRAECIMEGEFKFPLSYNFSDVLYIDIDIEWQDKQIVEPHY